MKTKPFGESKYMDCIKSSCREPTSLKVNFPELLKMVTVMKSAVLLVFKLELGIVQLRVGWRKELPNNDIRDEL